MRRRKKGMTVLTGMMIASLAFAGCAGNTPNGTAKESSLTEASSESTVAELSDGGESTHDGMEAGETDGREVIENSEDGGHAILADGETAEYSNINVEKTGEADGDEADFYGENSAIFATNGATLSLTDMEAHTDGTHANAVFSYGEGTTVNISDSTIETEGNCSGGIMTTGGGTMNAGNLTIHTTGNSSAAIRSDRGGGTVNVAGGTYSTDGTGSPAIYSTADITVTDAVLTSTASQGVVVEGQNSVTLKNVTLNADNNKKNSDKSDFYQAVMIYQSMSGDADEGTASFTAEDSTITNANGDVFFVNNTVADISLAGTAIVNNGDGVLLRSAAAGWGNDGSNGGNVNLRAKGQTLEGDMVIDGISTLNLYLQEDSDFTGAINPGAEAGGDVYVEIEDGSTWTLTEDSSISALTCGTGAINLNGYRLLVGGSEYVEGSESTGSPVEAKISEGHGGPGGPEGMGAPGGQGAPGRGGMPGSVSGNRPEGMPGGGQKGGRGGKGGPGPMGERPEGNPPEMPDGGNSTPPARPDGEMPGNGEFPEELPEGGMEAPPDNN